MAPHSSTLAWKIPWTEEPGRLQSMGSLRVRHDRATSLSLFTFMHWRRKWHPTPVFLPGESQGRGSLVGCRLRGCTESDTAEVTQQQQQQQQETPKKCHDHSKTFKMVVSTVAALKNYRETLKKYWCLGPNLKILTWLGLKATWMQALISDCECTKDQAPESWKNTIRLKKES